MKRNHREALRKRVARIAFGPSVGRVFKKKCRAHIVKALLRVDVTRLERLGSKAAYERWFRGELFRLARIVDRNNRGNSKIYPGYRWGHSAKILNIFVRDLIQSPYFTPG